MPETLLLLELVTQERSVDLAAMTQVVLNDVGATLQILKLAGLVYGGASDRPMRVEDCICTLGVEACLEAITSVDLSGDCYSTEMVGFWKHARDVAQRAGRIADALCDVNPDEAYLVGLLHSLGSLPAVLGWAWSHGGAGERAAAGLRLAERWGLPECVVELFREMNDADGPWLDLVHAAHAQVAGAHDGCGLPRSARPQLFRVV